MERLNWFFVNADLVRLVSPVLRVLAIGILLYNTDYVWLLLRTLWRRVRPPSEPPFHAPHGLLVLPTLLGKPADLAALQRAITSVVHNGYPGSLDVFAAIDGVGEQPVLYERLEAWVRELALPCGVRVFVAGGRARQGKAMAMEHAIERERGRVARGELATFPPVFFNLDADSELGPRALEHMVRRLHRPNALGRRPMIVASNVGVRRAHYYRGLRALCSVGGQLALQVAREYTQSIGVGKSNLRPVPVTGVSGALYCTWSYFHLEGARFSAYVRTLTVWDWLRWWVGRAPPCYATARVSPLPEAMTGPGDDTYLTWIAMMGRWRGSALSLELPPSPLHALGRLFVDWLFRPLAYDPRGAVLTSSPTTIRGLFRQRIRWNGSRAFTIRKLGMGLAFHFNVGLPVLLDMLLIVVTHATIALSLLALPFVATGDTPVSTLVLTALLTTFMRAFGTGLGMVMHGGWKHWPQLLALPLAIPYHFVFNVLTTIVALWQDLFWFGCNTGFSPETTLIATRTTRIALAYRVRRALALASRAIRHGDVPLGTFWFGFGETPYTPHGYQGWTSGARVGALKPLPTPAPRFESLDHARSSQAP